MKYLSFPMPMTLISTLFFPAAKGDEINCTSDKRRSRVNKENFVSSILDELNVFVRWEKTTFLKTTHERLGVKKGNMGDSESVHSTITDIDISNLQFGSIC